MGKYKDNIETSSSPALIGNKQLTYILFLEALTSISNGQKGDGLDVLNLFGEAMRRGLEKLDL